MCTGLLEALAFRCLAQDLGLPCIAPTCSSRIGLGAAPVCATGTAGLGENGHLGVFLCNAFPFNQCYLTLRDSLQALVT